MDSRPALRLAIAIPLAVVVMLPVFFAGTMRDTGESGMYKAGKSPVGNQPAGIRFTGAWDAAGVVDPAGATVSSSGDFDGDIASIASIKGDATAERSDGASAGVVATPSWDNETGTDTTVFDLGAQPAHSAGGGGTSKTPYPFVTGQGATGQGSAGSVAGAGPVGSFGGSSAATGSSTAPGTQTAPAGDTTAETTVAAEQNSDGTQTAPQGTGESTGAGGDTVVAAAPASSGSTAPAASPAAETPTANTGAETPTASPATGTPTANTGAAGTETAGTGDVGADGGTNEDGSTVRVVRDDPLALDGVLVVATNDTLTGTGTIIGDVVVEGTVAPGTSPGLLSIIGNLHISASGNILFELAGTVFDTGASIFEYDRIDVTDNPDTNTVEGNLTVAGGATFEIDYYDGFEADIGNEFFLLVADDMSFNTGPLNITFPELSGEGWYWDYGLVDFGDGREAFRIQVLNAEAEADANANANPNANPNPNANANAGGGGGGATIAAVPEPGTLAIFGFGLIGLAALRRKRTG